jgi:uncharacterized RDD family membrane protein YckC
VEQQKTASNDQERARQKDNEQSRSGVERKQENSSCLHPAGLEACARFVAPTYTIMQLYIAKDGKQTGPYSEDQIRSMIEGGLISNSDYFWREGLTEWQPLSQHFGSSLSSPPPFRSVGNHHVSANTLTNEHPGFWLRCAAHLIDSIIVYILAFVAGFIIGVVFGVAGQADADILKIFGGLAGLAASWLYYALMESSAKQATLGKMACGFVVTDLLGQRISFRKATGRYFGMILSALILCIGFMMCGWTERKQCLHDMMAGCLMFKTLRTQSTDLQ